MKQILEKIKEIFKSKDEDNIDTKKSIIFFGFYFVFFVIVFLVIIFGGRKDFLYQEYEKGNSINKGLLMENYVFDFKITNNGVLHDYYGKRYNSTEMFKYNNLDYYCDKEDCLVNKDGWIKSDNPYKFYEIIKYDALSGILSKATFMTKDELENGNIELHYLISSNTLNKVLYDLDTDYDEEPDSIDILTNSDGEIIKITYRLDHFCSHREECGSTLTIEKNFEMFGSVEKIDNPIG